MKFSSCLLVLTCMLFQISVKSQEDWVLRKDKKGIKVFSRKTDKFKVNELKVESMFEGRISQLAAVLMDADNHHQWVYKTVKSQLLKVISATSIVYYSEIECPWPLDNRDFVLQMSITQNLQNKVMTIEVKNVNDYLPIKKDIVRIKYLRTTWTITPLNNNQFKVDNRIQVDPGDGVPAWLLNIFTINGPYDTFLHLKEEIKLPQYAKAKFPFLLD